MDKKIIITLGFLSSLISIKDTSGSMQGARIKACKAFLEKCLLHLIENNLKDITLINFKTTSKTIHLQE